MPIVKNGSESFSRTLVCIRISIKSLAGFAELENGRLCLSVSVCFGDDANVCMEIFSKKYVIPFSPSILLAFKFQFRKMIENAFGKYYVFKMGFHVETTHIPIFVYLLSV